MGGCGRVNGYVCGWTDELVRQGKSIWTGVPEAEVIAWVEESVRKGMSRWEGLCEETNELVGLDVKGEMVV